MDRENHQCQGQMPGAMSIMDTHTMICKVGFISVSSDKDQYLKLQEPHRWRLIRIETGQHDSNA